MEPPTKRRRLSFETAAMIIPPATVENVSASASELLAEEVRMLIQTESDIGLDSSSSSYFVIARHSKKIIDRRIALKDKQLWKWRQNVKIYCRKLNVIPLIKHQIPAINFFKQPSYLPMRWNANLRDLFVHHITSLFMSLDEDIAPASCNVVQETMRVEKTSGLNFSTEDLNMFPKMDTPILAEPVDNIVNILPMTNIVHKTADVSVPSLPKVILDTIILEKSTSIVEYKQD